MQMKKNYIATPRNSVLITSALLAEPQLEVFTPPRTQEREKRERNLATRLQAQTSCFQNIGAVTPASFHGRSG
jgi:hypothetical protein